MRLVDTINIGKESYSKRTASTKNPTLIKSPVAYIEERNETFLYLLNIGGTNLLNLLEQLPSTNIAVVNKKEEMELIKEGIPHFFEYATENVNQLIKENKTEISKYLSVESLIDTINSRYFSRSYSESSFIRRLLSRDIIRNVLGISGPVSFVKMADIVNLHKWINSRKTHPKFSVFSGVLPELPKARLPSEKTIAKIYKCVKSPHIDLLGRSFMFHVEDERIARKLINILLDYETEE